jgi:hypothetical protein
MNPLLFKGKAVGATYITSHMSAVVFALIVDNNNPARRNNAVELKLQKSRLIGHARKILLDCSSGDGVNQQPWQ